MGKDRMLALLNDHDNWAMWPCMPLKHHERGLGVLIATDDAKLRTTVFLGNMFDNNTPLRDRPKEEFASMEAILAAGWEID